MKEHGGTWAFEIGLDEDKLPKFRHQPVGFGNELSLGIHMIALWFWDPCDVYSIAITLPLKQCQPPERPCDRSDRWFFCHYKDPLHNWNACIWVKGQLVALTPRLSITQSPNQQQHQYYDMIRSILHNSLQGSLSSIMWAYVQHYRATR